MVEFGAISWLYQEMRGFIKFSSQVPQVVRERFMQLHHGEKQLACTGGLVWYFNADEKTRRLYREWARAIAEEEDGVTVATPPESVRIQMKKRPAKSGRPPKKARKGKRSG